MRTRSIATILVATALLTSACTGRPKTSERLPTATPGAPPSQSQSPPAQNPPAGGAPSQGTSGQPAQPAPEPPKAQQPVPRKMPTPVRGIHLSGWVAGSPDLLKSLLDWCKSAGINTVVLEVKAEDGKVTWISDVPLAQEIGANTRKVGDIRKLMEELHAQGFWVIGRIVVMNDAFLYSARPKWGIPGFSGGAYSFMDPKNEEVWRYNIDLAKTAVAVGFDEIQFDYIRYPEKLVTGYNRDTGADFRTANINGFLKAAAAELKPLGAIISADVFGLTTSVAEGDDMQIGQDYKQIAEIVDYVSAMVYPSHYARGTYGIENPDASPYETVKQSMGKAIERTAGMPVAKHRPWIQDFTYPAAGATPYGKPQVLGQVKALQELGIDSFLLWDPSNKYTRSIDYTKEPPKQ